MMVKWMVPEQVDSTATPDACDAGRVCGCVIVRLLEPAVVEPAFLPLNIASD
jgi:hypothetical protein